MHVVNRSAKGLVFLIGLAACLAGIGAVSAQAAPTQLVPAAEFYFGDDARTTRPVVALQGEGDALAESLLKAIARNPRAKAETAQLAHIAMTGGRPELGIELYGRALRQVSPTEALYRPLLWNYGWDLLRNGNAADALTQWETLLKTRNSTADWMPPTFALALWMLDRRDEAVQWYAAAVRTHPDKWSGNDQYEALLPGWQDGERAVLAEIQQAWQVDPPQWR